MAENKNSFLLYCDIIHTIEKLPDDKAGILFKHILKYVNDLNPITDDLIIELTFEPIKQQLKRDLKKWENERNSRSEAGKKGMESRWNKEKKQNNNDITKITKDNNVINTITNITDNVSVSVNDNVIVNDKKKINKFIKPTILEIKNYCIERKNSVDAEKFFNFYESKGWMVGKNKMKDWKACVRTWESKENNQQTKISPQDSRINHLQNLLKDE